MQWVGEEDWIYRCQFRLDTLPKSGEQADLNFEGLDTFASIFRESPMTESFWARLTLSLLSVNGRKILETDNMFTPYR